MNNQLQEQPMTFTEHECDNPFAITYTQQKELQYQKCYCGHVVRFRYKSFWRRLYNLFFKEKNEI